LTELSSTAAPAPAGFRFDASISVFFPAYNDAPALPELLRRTFETLARCAADYEVIVVNDGSQDDTAAVLERLAAQYGPRLRVITHARNQGYGAALRSGFAAARKDYIFYTDGDGQYDPRELELLLHAAGPRTALVNGYKQTRNDPWHRIAIGWLYNHFARWLFRIQLRDIDCDFRLIRRADFDPRALRSTGGTICVELVRQLELTGAEIVEVPVSHYARQHGRSQFFRLQSLAVTFWQLCQVYFRLVLWPALTGTTPRRTASGRRVAGVAMIIAALAVLAYARTLTLPFISDDYIQIQLARDYGPADRWNALAADALYRCRATSLLVTYWLEQVFGLDPFAFRAAGLGLHIVNSLLVFALGFWPVIGWRTSAAAAAIFAVSQRHSEAVIWHAALPELLVFLFSIGSVLAWIAWLKRGGAWYALALGSYLLALASKESAVAVVPLLLAVLWTASEISVRRLAALAPFAVVAAGYFAAIFAARENHLHFQDGTFSLHAPVVEVLARSSLGLLWPWGSAAAAAFLFRLLPAPPKLLALSAVWLLAGLLPYSFLTYMPRVPSRHTYLASVALAWLVGAAWIALAGTPVARRRLWLIPTVFAGLGIFEGGYIWWVQYPRFVARAQPTELLLRAAANGDDTIRASCFPYSPYIAEATLRLRFPGRPALRLEHNPEAAQHPAAQDFCNRTVEGTRYGPLDFPAIAPRP
jgi:hypothetical protein